MSKKIPDAAPLTGAETAIVIQEGKAVKTTAQEIANRGPTKAGKDGINGTDGKSVELRVDSGFIQWRQTGSASWTNIIDTASLVGKPGKDGADGKSIELQKSSTAIQWRQVGSTAWIDLVLLSALMPSPKRIERFTGTTNSTGIATVSFDPAFNAIPDLDVIEDWTANDQMVTGKVITGTATKTGCQVQVMLSRGTLVLTSGPFQKAGSGVSITVKATGN